jgi:diketogulonate reductase-like aldo/keto reductase
MRFQARRLRSFFLFSTSILCAVVSANEAKTKEATIPTITIGHDVGGNPVELPLVGAGTGSHYNSSMAYQSLCAAFSVGYSFVDTAFNYHNEGGVGNAIRDCWEKSREELFVMTKVPGGLNKQQIYAAHKQNLLELGLDYVDHLMFHFPADYNGKHASPDVRQEGWRALEAIYKSGEARSIGVSHYCPQHIHDIMDVATVTPSINQVEFHVGSQDVDNVQDTCKEYGITFMSYSPLCGNCNYGPEDSLINGELVSEIASHYKDVSGSQIALRYIVQQQIPAIPRSLSKQHLASNLDIFGFELSDDDMQQLSAATKPQPHGGRDCVVP